MTAEYRKQYRDAHYRWKRKYYAIRREDAFNSRASWTQEETDAVLRRDVTDTELSKEIGRSVFAIQAKRAKEKAAQELQRTTATEGKGL